MKGFRTPLILLQCCYLLSFIGTIDSLCSNTAIWKYGQDLDVLRAKENNVTFNLSSVYTTNSAKQCAVDCCTQSKGGCDIASYNRNESKCEHYFCDPISKCSLISRNETDTFFRLSTRPPLTDSINDDFINLTSTVTSMLFSTVLSSTYKPILRGDGTKSKPRKGAFPDEILLNDEEVELKRDNLSSVARKGVDNSGQNRLETNNNETVIEFPVAKFTENPFNESVAVVTPSTDGFIEREGFLVSSSIKPVLNLTTEYITIKNNINLTTTITSKNKEPFKVIGRGSVELLDHQNGVSEKVDRLFANGTIVEFMKSESTLVNSDTYQAFISSDSLHLVVGLSLGLLLLLTVLGLVGKRIHDSWQRRHYSRMDFLIDGMYHGEQ